MLTAPCISGCLPTAAATLGAAPRPPACLQESAVRQELFMQAESIKAARQAPKATDIGLGLPGEIRPTRWGGQLGGLRMPDRRGY